MARKEHFTAFHHILYVFLLLFLYVSWVLVGVGGALIQFLFRTDIWSLSTSPIGCRHCKKEASLTKVEIFPGLSIKCEHLGSIWQRDHSITIVGSTLRPMTSIAMDFWLGLHYQARNPLPWIRPQIQSENSSKLTPNNHASIAPLGTSLQADWYCSLQGPALGKTIAVFYFPEGCIEFSSCMKASYQGGYFLVGLR